MFSVVTSKFIRSSKLPSAAFPITVIRFLTFTNTENKTRQLVFFPWLPLLPPFFQEALTNTVLDKKKGDVKENALDFLKQLQANYKD